MPRTRSIIPSVRKACKGAANLARVDEWWANKLCPILGVTYASACQLHLALNALWPVLGFLLTALVAVGTYANLLNNLCDIREDELCGKKNRLARRSPFFRAAALIIVFLLGMLIAWALWPNLTLLTLYLGVWVMFTLYSLPPIRLKVRGFLGVLADAAGAHLLPQLFTLSLIAAWGRDTFPAPAWVVAVAVWSLARGVRGILWHQLRDATLDKQAGVNTFVQRRSQRHIQLLGERLWFPLELAGLGAMLVLSGTVLGWVLLAIHLMLETARTRLWGVSVIVVMPRENFRFALDEYYELFFPFTFLLSASRQHPPDILVLVVHLLLFPGRAKFLVRNLYDLLLVALDPSRRPGRGWFGLGHPDGAAAHHRTGDPSTGEPQPSANPPNPIAGSGSATRSETSA